MTRREAILAVFEAAVPPGLLTLPLYAPDLEGVAINYGFDDDGTIDVEHFANQTVERFNGVLQGYNFVAWRRRPEWLIEPVEHGGTRYKLRARIIVRKEVASEMQM